MTADTPAPGLHIHQPARGFRYGAEAFWLAGFALQGGEARTALDLGTGSGIIALLLARAGLTVVGIDVRSEWGPLWEQTMAESRFGGSAALRQGDVARVDMAVDLVVSNPPFFARAAGPVASDPWKAAARTESTASLDDFIQACRPTLTAGGRACFVLPVSREDEALERIQAVRARVRRHVRVGRARVLLEFAHEVDAPARLLAVTESDRIVQDWYARAMSRPAAACGGPIG